MKPPPDRAKRASRCSGPVRPATWLIGFIDQLDESLDHIAAVADLLTLVDGADDPLHDRTVRQAGSLIFEEVGRIRELLEEPKSVEGRS